MNGNIIEQKLNQSFLNVNEWLKFAEAKNGALLAFNGALIIGLLSLYKNMPELMKTPITWILIPFLILSLIIVLTSFLPIRDKFFRYNIVNKNISLDNINLLFYGDLRVLSVSKYLKLIYESYEKPIPITFNKAEKDLAHQILNNAAIAYNKYTFFTICTYLNFFGFLSAIFVFILKLL